MTIGLVAEDSQAVTVPHQYGFLGHPRALAALFFTETWERFSYYGMRAILVYYLYFPASKGGLGIAKKSALSQVSAYVALIYMLGVLGGWISDRLIGSRRTVLYGGVTIMLGHLVLAMPTKVTGAYLGLLFIVIGTGLLKTNVSKLVGDLYATADERRDAGFSIFYVGLSLGGFLGQTVVGWMQKNIGFHAAFAATAIGMALGLSVYVLSRPSLGSAGSGPTNPLSPAERSRAARVAGLGALAIALAVLMLVVTGHLNMKGVVNLVTWVSCLLAVGYFTFILRSPRTDPVERDRVVAYIPIFLAAVIFALLSNQQFSVLAVYAAERVDLGIFGWSFPPSWFASVDVLAIVFIAPFAALLWIRLGDRQPTIHRKASFSLLLVGLSFLVVMLASRLTGPDGLVNALWLIGVYLIMALGEVLLSPVGLSATTKLAPRAFASQTMGLWFLSGAVGNGLGAQVVKLYSDQHEVRYFGVLGASAVAAAVLLYTSAPRFRGLMHGLI